jgi:hypothetical protein
MLTSLGLPSRAAHTGRRMIAIVEPMKVLSRRQAILLSLSVPLIPLASGCRASLPAWSASSSEKDARSLLHDTATAHGLSAYSSIDDLNVSYAGHWRRLVGILQPVLVDSGFRGGSEERLLPREGVIAQSHLGTKGHKQVVRISTAHSGSSTHVWLNGEETFDRDRVDAAALVAEAYSLFLLGPILLDVNARPRRGIQAALAGTTEVTQAKRKYLCDVLNLRMSPGIGNSESDQLALYIDHESRLMRRVRMTLNGLESTRGALVDIDTYEHRSMHGVMWPTAFHERLLRPAPLDVHEWRLTGLDINRGESAAELTGSAFTGKALAPAAPTNG